MTEIGMESVGEDDAVGLSTAAPLGPRLEKALSAHAREQAVAKAFACFSEVALEMAPRLAEIHAAQKNSRRAVDLAARGIEAHQLSGAVNMAPKSAQRRL